MNSVKRFGIVLLFSIILLQLGIAVSGAQGAQTITGLSGFQIATNQSTIALNSSLSIPFNVTLASGSAGTTYLIVANGAQLQSDGIYVGINPSSGTPSFSGTLYINTNVNQGVVPGTYTLMIESGGADPIYPGVFNFTLTVLNTASTTSTVQGSTTSYSVTSAPTTTVSGGSGSTTPSSGSNLLSLGLAGIIIILIIIILAFVALRSRAPKK